jgi:hypothetical protein
MREKYLELSGLRHSSKQLRNRWTQLKSLYTFWLMLNNHTDFGRGPHGEIIASEKTWKEACAVILLIAQLICHALTMLLVLVAMYFC